MVGYLHISFLRWVNQAWMCEESGIIIEKTGDFGAAESGLKSSFRWDEFFNIIERGLIFHSSQIFSKFNFNENEVQCFNIGNQGFYSIFGRNRNILRLKYKVILPCSAQLSTRTLLNFPEVLTLHPNLHSSKSPRLVSVIFDSTMQKWHTTHHYNVSSIRLRRHFHIAHDTHIVPPPPLPHPKKCTRFVRFGEGQGAGKRQDVFEALWQKWQIAN